MFDLNGVPGSPDGDALIKFVTRKPNSLFSLRKNAKNEEEKKKLSLLLELLKQKLPDGFKIGAALGEEDSFYDSIAQGLNELRDKGLITSPNAFSVKSLRESCKQYAQQVNQSHGDSWLVNALKENGIKLRKYIRNVEFTARDIERSSSKTKVLWGRPEIEGIMICEMFDVKVRIIELRDQETEGFVTKRKFGRGKITIYIVHFRNHFVPLLSNIEKNVRKTIKICSEKVYGNVISSNSKDFSQPYLPTLLEDISDKEKSRSSPNKEYCETSRKRRCSITDQDIKSSKRACIEVITINNEDTELLTDVQKEPRQVGLHRERRYSNEDKDNEAPKRMLSDVKDTGNEYLAFSSDLQDELDVVYQNNRCIPQQLIKFMYQLDLSVLCSIRKSTYEFKYPSLSLAFGDSETEKFGNIILFCKEKSIHVQVESVDKYFTDNFISYDTLFDKKHRRQGFFISDFFNSFVKHIISKSKAVEYLIVYTNADFGFTEEMKLKQGQSRNFYPFEFHKMNIEDCSLVKDFLFTNDDMTEGGFYQFSLNKTTREELLKRLEFSSAVKKEIKKEISSEVEREIKETFCNKLVFAVNQPNREELNKIVKREVNSKVDGSYIVLENILCEIRSARVHEKQGNNASEILYSFSVLLSLMHDMFLNDHLFSINLIEKSCDRTNDIIINFKDRTTYMKIFNAERNIGYSQLFPSKKQASKFSINKHFTLFIEALEKDKNLRYYVIYTNKDLDLTPEMMLKKAQTKNFQPFKFDRIDIGKKKYKILRNGLCIKKNYLYRFSQKEATKLFSLLKLPPSFLRDKDFTDNDQELKENFLHKLIFAVNQPTGEELNTIIRDGIESSCNEVINNYEELHEIALRWLESQEFGLITKERMEIFCADLKSNRSSFRKIQNKDISKEIKFARSVVGSEGIPPFYQFLDFLIKEEGMKYLLVLKRQGIDLRNMSSILYKAGSNATKAFTDLYNLWFDSKGNKTVFLKSLEKEGMKLSNISSIIHRSGRNAVKAFKELYYMWFDVNGNKTECLKTLQDEGINMANVCSLLNRAGPLGGEAFNDLYHLWFDASRNKTKYLKTFENQGVNLTNMSSILKGTGFRCAKFFKDLNDLWFDAEGNKTLYLKSIEDEGMNLTNMTSILSRSGTKAVDAFKDLYDLWFDEKGYKTRYLKALEDEGVNLANMSSVLNGAGSNAAKAFKKLYDLWFDAKGKKTLYLRTLEVERVNLASMSSILSGAGSKAAQAFKELHCLWFDAKGHKTLYLRTLEDNGVNLSNVSSILQGAGFKAGNAFKDLYDTWFDATGNKTPYLKTLENEGVNMPNVSSILHRAGSRAKKAFTDLYDLWFDIRGNKTLYLRTLEDEGVNLSNMSSILHGAGSKAEQAFKELYHLWFDRKGNKTPFFKSLEKEGVNLSNMSSILSGAGSVAEKASKDLYHLWFDPKGNKTIYLKTLESEGVNLPNMSSILSGAGSSAAKSFKDLYNLWFDAKGNKTLYLKTLEEVEVNLPSMSSILSGAGSKAAISFKFLYSLWFDVKGNKTKYLKNLEDQGVNLRHMSSILNGAGSKAEKAFKDLYHLWFDAKGNKTLYLKALEAEGVNLHNMSSILDGSGSKAGKAFKELHHLWFDEKGNKTLYLKTLEREGVNLPNISSILHRAGSKAAKTFKDLHSLWFDAKGYKTPYLKTLENEGISLCTMSSILHSAGSKAEKAFKDLYHLWFDANGNKTLYLKTLEDETIDLPIMSSILNGAGSNAAKAFKELYHLWFDEKGNKTEYFKILEEEVALPNMSRMLHGAGSKAGKAFKDLLDMHFDEQGKKTPHLKIFLNQKR